MDLSKYNPLRQLTVNPHADHAEPEMTHLPSQTFLKIRTKKTKDVALKASTQRSTMEITPRL